MQQDPYTRVPNLVYDIVGPLLTSPERDCLFYIVRRTWGFPDANGAPKARDTIGLDQFENGIASGNTLLDLGTQLSRNTIKKALLGLEEKELVEVRFSCLKCLWEQEKGEEVPERASGRGHECPRCSASLSRSWALAELTPRKLTDLLNEHDRRGRQWFWDKEQRRFRFEDIDGEKARRQNDIDLQAEIDRIKELIWYPELVEKVLSQAGGVLQSGKVSLSRQINSFWKPVWDIQEKYPSPPLIKHALEQTIKAGVAAKPRNDRWHRYLEAVVRNAQSDFAPTKNSEREIENKTRDLLRRAAALNGSGQAESAREILADILALRDGLAPLFDNDSELCEKSLREAYKQGASDFIGIKPDPYGLDFYPEWSWS